MSDKTVLIFGVSGFVGPHLANEFHVSGYDVYGTDLNQSTTLPQFIKFSLCDILDSDEVNKIIQKIRPTHIVNLAAISSVKLSWQIPQRTVAVNVEGAINILEGVKKQSYTPKILLIGSSEEYIITDHPINETTELNANNPYGISKVMQEKFANIYYTQYGIPIYYTRAFNHTGLGQSESFVIPNWCKQVAQIEKSNRSGEITVGNLDIMRDFSHVKDIVRAYRLVIESNNPQIVYNVGTGKTTSLNNILSYITSLSHQEIITTIDKSIFRTTDNPVICADISLIQSKLNWAPQYNIFDAAQELYHYYLNS